MRQFHYENLSSGAAIEPKQPFRQPTGIGWSPSSPCPTPGMKPNDHPELRPLWDRINSLELERVHHRNEETRIEREIGQLVQEALAKRKKLFPTKSPSPYAKENR